MLMTAIRSVGCCREDTRYLQCPNEKSFMYWKYIIGGDRTIRAQLKGVEIYRHKLMCQQSCSRFLPRGAKYTEAFRVQTKLFLRPAAASSSKL